MAALWTYACPVEASPASDDSLLRETWRTDGTVQLEAVSGMLRSLSAPAVESYVIVEETLVLPSVSHVDPLAADRVFACHTVVPSDEVAVKNTSSVALLIWVIPDVSVTYHNADSPVEGSYASRNTGQFASVDRLSLAKFAVLNWAETGFSGMLATLNTGWYSGTPLEITIESLSLADDADSAVIGRFVCA